MSATSDRNLLFGVLALQIDAITQDQLIQAMQAWVADKSRTLGELLLQQGALSQDQFTALEALVGARIKMFDNDPTKGLAQLNSAADIGQVLSEVQDRDLDASLRMMGSTVPSRPAGDTVGKTADERAPIRTLASDARYRIEKLHDEGGLGRVFVAEDTELSRQVALKELKASMAHDADSRTRFVAEAEITGGLEHPGIVPVYSLGQYDDGRPFYAMRFIQGDNLQVKIREFHEKDWSQDGGASAKSMELRRLLSRFVDVCEAIHYAHKRGILHRDIKPANIMVGSYGETLVVDWGLAKWLGQREFASEESVEVTLLPRSGSGASATRLGTAAGTPAFMSPEQARGEHDQLGPATDIYGLGATLYALLTNQRPFEGATDILAAVRRGDRQRPRSVMAAIPRPLEAICLHAMAFDPQQRYPSAEALARDMEQFLGDEPVTAYREGIFERARRWLRRHSAVAATLLGIGFMALILLLVVGRFNQQLAQVNQQLAQEEQRAETVTDFMIAAFDRTDPNQDGRSITVAQVLDIAQGELDAAQTDDLTKAELLYAIGRSYFNLGLYDQSVAVLEESKALANKLLGKDDLETLKIDRVLNEAYSQTGRHTKAIPALEYDLQQFRRELGAADRETLLILNNLAAAYERDGQFDKALPLFVECLELRRTALGPLDKDTLVSQINLAQSYLNAGRQDEAALLFLDDDLEQRMFEELGTKNIYTITFINNKAIFLYGRGQVAQALPLLRSMFELRREILGSEHVRTLESMHSLGRCLQSLGELDEAESLYQEILQLVGDSDRGVQIREWKALQSVQLQQGKYDQALETIERWRRALAHDGANAVLAELSRAEALLGLGQTPEALAILQSVVSQAENFSELETQRAQGLLGSAQSPTTGDDQAVTRMLSAFEWLVANLPATSPHYRWYAARAGERLLEHYRELGDAEEAEQWEQELSEVNAEIVRLRDQ